MQLEDGICEDIWVWFREFVTVPNDFYKGKFPPCPYAQNAILTNSVDVRVWTNGDVREFIYRNAIGMCNSSNLTTRVMAFPPRTQFFWGIGEYIETLNSDLVKNDVFLNTGVAKTTRSRYPGQLNSPYFIVVANGLEAVLKGAVALQKTDYYLDWPRKHYELVVERRARTATRRSLKSLERSAPFEQQ